MADPKIPCDPSLKMCKLSRHPTATNMCSPSFTMFVRIRSFSPHSGARPRRRKRSADWNLSPIRWLVTGTMRNIPRRQLYSLIRTIRRSLTATMPMHLRLSILSVSRGKTTTAPASPFLACSPCRSHTRPSVKLQRFLSGIALTPQILAFHHSPTRRDSGPPWSPALTPILAISLPHLTTRTTTEIRPTRLSRTRLWSFNPTTAGLRGRTILNSTPTADCEATRARFRKGESVCLSSCVGLQRSPRIQNLERALIVRRSLM